MSGSTFEQLRLPAALLLIVIAAFVFWPRGDGQASSVQATPTPTVVAGQPGGQVVAPTVEPPPPTPIPTLSSPPSAAPTPVATPVATADPTPVPEPPAAAQDGFTAELLVCQSISGATCNGQLANVPPNVGSVTALVRFTGANGGDVINAILRGPSGTFDGGIYSLQGGGDGYYYATFGMQGLEPGDYIVTATRNGDEVATTGFAKRGG
ncbi:MAG: hypothetical protein LC798_03895 [Chloroflexi bacterium]|nr:hypothetical protein [Chloroflexota bacterium]